MPSAASVGHAQPDGRCWQGWHRVGAGGAARRSEGLPQNCPGDRLGTAFPGSVERRKERLGDGKSVAGKSVVLPGRLRWWERWAGWLSCLSEEIGDGFVPQSPGEWWPMRGGLSGRI